MFASKVFKITFLLSSKLTCFCSIQGKNEDFIFVLISKKKNKEKIALLENKKFKKGCFKPSGCIL